MGPRRIAAHACFISRALVVAAAFAVVCLSLSAHGCRARACHNPRPPEEAVQREVRSPKAGTTTKKKASRPKNPSRLPRRRPRPRWSSSATSSCRRARFVPGRPPASTTATAAAPRRRASIAARAGRELHQARPHGRRLVGALGQWVRPQVNSPDYRLCVYLFDVRPRTEAGPDSRTALQAVMELSDPAKFFPWRLADENVSGAPAHRRRRRSRVAGRHARRHFLDGRRARPLAAAFLDRRRSARGAGGIADNVRSPDHPLVLGGQRTATLARTRGFEAMDLAGDNKTLVTILEGAVTGDASADSGACSAIDTAAGNWLPALLYMSWMRTPCRSPTCRASTAIASWSSSATICEGDAAKAKRVYSIDLDKAMPGKPLAKKLVIDLLAIGNARGLAETAPPGAPFRYPYLTIESIQVLDRKHVVLVNDNNYPATGGRGAARRRRDRMAVAGARQSSYRLPVMPT